MDADRSFAMLEFVYALTAEGVPFFVGRTDDLSRRYQEHLASASPSGNPTERHILRLLDEGRPIRIKILQTCATGEMPDEEALWVKTLEAAGFQLFVGQTRASAWWSPELFTNAKWEKCRQCREGERSTMLNGVKFYRYGRRRLRFAHPLFGHWPVHARDLSAMYAKACRMLTKGTREHEEMMVQSRVAEMIRQQVLSEIA